MADRLPWATTIHTSPSVREEIPVNDRDKIRSYIEQYMPFHARFDGLPQRAVDKAV